MVSDPDVTRFTGDGCQTLEEARKRLEEGPFQDYWKYGYGRWAAVYKPTGKVVGFAGLKYLDDVGEVDLGFRFFKEQALSATTLMPPPSPIAGSTGIQPGI